MTTDDPVLGRSIARLRVHGMEPKYHHHEVGFNSRLDSLQAAVLRVKLRHLDTWTGLRREAADRYDNLFEAHGLTDLVNLPGQAPGRYHVYNQYVIRVPAPVRDPLRDYLTSRQIGTEIYYPIPLHLQPCFSSMGHKPGDFPIAESAARETLALPIYPELIDEQQRFVVGSIRQFLDANAHVHLAASDKAA
jgi:dTDP-4-amino-4,6-dideoxygalactose transaminase